MNLYHVWFDLRPGAKDTELARHVDAYLGALRDQGKLRSFRLTRRKLGFGPPHLGEFHLWMEFDDLAQLDAAFQTAAARRDPIESLHHAVNRWAANFQAALYRDFPDPVRHEGEERF